MSRARKVALAFSIGVAIVGTAAAAAIRPDSAVPVGAALTLAVLAWWAPRVFLGTGLLLVLLSAVPEGLGGAAWGLVDEIVVVVGIVVLPARRVARRTLPRVPAWTLWFVGFLALGLLSSLLASVPAGIAFEGAFLAMKGLLLGLAAAQIDWRPADLRPLAWGGSAVIVVVAGTCLVNLVAPGWWTALLLGEPTDFRGLFGIPAVIGPFAHPAALGRLCALLAIAVLSWQLSVGRGWRSTVLLVLSAAPAALSFRVKSLVSLGIGAVVVGALRRERFPRWVAIVLAVTAVVVAIPVSVLAFEDFTKYFIDESARSLLVSGGVDVAARYFPLGAGFGRYGGFTAASHYSPEYVRLGFEVVYGLRSTPGGGQFLTDTQWPALLGEAGWFGALLFAAGLVHLGVLYMRRLPADVDPLVVWLRTMGLGWLVVIVVESVAAPVFTSPPSYPLLFVAAGIYTVLSDSARISRP